MLGTFLQTSPLTNGFRDPAFTRNKETPLHRWVPWIAGFSAQFVDDCLGKYLQLGNKKDVWVLDPFAGVGTTLVQAFLHGFNVVGFEINPYAVLACRAKLEAARLSVRELDRHVSAFERYMQGRCPDNGAGNGNPRSKPPEGFSGRTQLFSPKVEHKVLFVKDFISRIDGPWIRDLFRLALGSVMVSFSNYSYEPSLTRRAAVDKPNIPDAPVAAVVAAKLRLMLEDIAWLQRHLHEVGHIPEQKVFHDSFFTAAQAIKRRAFVDLVVTSPPYLNNYHYPRNTRPQLHWLGFASGPGYKGAGEGESFGKFWQTVRDLPAVNLGFDLPALQRAITLIRSLNTSKGQYGGAGWANYVATYFNDTYRFWSTLHHLLRAHAKVIVVLGNSVIQGVEVKTDVFFGQIAELCGLDFEETVLLRKKRTGSSIIQSAVRVDKASEKTVLYETAVIVSRPALSRRKFSIPLRASYAGPASPRNVAAKAG
jgi:DNA modification methylase